MKRATIYLQADKDRVVEEMSRNEAALILRWWRKCRGVRRTVSHRFLVAYRPAECALGEGALIFYTRHHSKG